MVCKQCGKEINANAKFCKACGAAQEQQPQQQSQQPMQQYGQFQQQNIYDTPQVRALIGSNADYFIKKFNEMTLINKSKSWNWGGFFLGFIWMLYRKVYKKHLGIFIVSIITQLISLIGFVDPISAIIFTIPAWIINIIIAVNGNFYYKKYIDGKLGY